MTQTHKNLILGLIIVAILAVVWLTAGQKSDSRKVVIGGLFHLSGFAAFAGEASRDGFLMAIEDSGIATSTITVVIEDVRSDASATVSGATKLTTIDKAIVVLGPEWTEFGEVVAPIANREKIPFISPWIVAESSFVKPPYFWSASPSYRSEHAALAEYMARSGLNRISVVYSNNAWSHADLSMFKEEAARYPELIFISEQGLDQTARDYRTVIAKIKADTPDFVYSAIAEDEGYGTFLSQARQLGVTQPIGTFSSRATSQVLKNRFANFLPGEVFAESVLPQKSEEFAAKYEKRFGKKVGAESAAATYDMTTLVLKAVKNGATTSEDIISYLQKVKGYDGYSGLIEYDEKGLLPMRKAVVKKYNSQGVAEEVR